MYHQLVLSIGIRACRNDGTLQWMVQKKFPNFVRDSFFFFNKTLIVVGLDVISHQNTVSEIKKHGRFAVDVLSLSHVFQQ